MNAIIGNGIFAGIPRNPGVPFVTEQFNEVKNDEPRAESYVGEIDDLASKVVALRAELESEALMRKFNQQNSARSDAMIQILKAAGKVTEADIAAAKTLVGA